MASNQGRAFPARKLFNPQSPSQPTLKTLDTTGVLAMIHDAIGHMVGPVNKLLPALSMLERIAKAVEKIAGQTEVSDALEKRKPTSTRMIGNAFAPFPIPRRRRTRSSRG